MSKIIDKLLKNYRTKVLNELRIRNFARSLEKGNKFKLNLNSTRR